MSDEYEAAALKLGKIYLRVLSKEYPSLVDDAWTPKFNPEDFTLHKSRYAWWKSTVVKGLYNLVNVGDLLTKYESRDWSDDLVEMTSNEEVLSIIRMSATRAYLQI